MTDQHIGNEERPLTPAPEEAAGDASFSTAQGPSPGKPMSDVQEPSQVQVDSVAVGKTHQTNDPAAKRSLVVDWDEARRLIPGGPDVLVELIEAVQLECVSILAELGEAVTRQDAKQLMRAAHTLKSSARYFGATRVVDAAFKLEDIGRRGAMDGAALALEELRPLVDMLLNDLANSSHNSQPSDGV